MEFLSVRTTGSLFRVPFLGLFFLLSVCFVQFRCVRFCFILLYSIIILQKPVCFLMIQSGIWLGESEEEMWGVEGGDSIIGIYDVRILFSIKILFFNKKKNVKNKSVIWNVSQLGDNDIVYRATAFAQGWEVSIYFMLLSWIPTFDRKPLVFSGTHQQKPCLFLHLHSVLPLHVYLPVGSYFLSLSINIRQVALNLYPSDLAWVFWTDCITKLDKRCAEVRTL